MSEAPRNETIETTGRSGTARGDLRTPGNGTPWPAVLLCPGAPVEAADFGPLLDDAAAALTDAGFATLVVSSRLADPLLARASSAQSLIDDCDALLEWLIACDQVDASRVALIGYSTGALAAAAVGGMSVRLNGIAFIAPASSEQLLKWLERSGDGGPVDEAVVESFQALDGVADATRFPTSTLVMQGAAELAAGGSAGPAFVEGLIANGVSPQSLIVAHAHHPFASVAGRLACLDQLLSFVTGLPARATAGAS